MKNRARIYARPYVYREARPEAVPEVYVKRSDGRLVLVDSAAGSPSPVRVLGASAGTTAPGALSFAALHKKAGGK